MNCFSGKPSLMEWREAWSLWFTCLAWFWHRYTAIVYTVWHMYQAVLDYSLLSAHFPSSPAPGPTFFNTASQLSPTPAEILAICQNSASELFQTLGYFFWEGVPEMVSLLLLNSSHLLLFPLLCSYYIYLELCSNGLISPTNCEAPRRYRPDLTEPRPNGTEGTWSVTAGLMRLLITSLIS